MYKKTITYETYEDEPQTIVEDFYFNINRAEMYEMTLGIEGGLEQYLSGLLIERNMPKLSKFVTDLIKKSYGRRTPDGIGFEKSPEILNRFLQTDAYSQLLYELVSDETGAKFNEFILKTFPKAKDENGKVITLDIENVKKEVSTNNPALANAMGLDQE